MIDKGSAVTALIRVFNSELTIRGTLESLEAQSEKPGNYVFVDSGSVDRTLEVLPSDALVVRYEGQSYNHAAALNQGLRHIRSPLVLIISSHTVLDNREALRFACGLLADTPSLGAVYFTADPGELCYTRIDKESFDGFNGLWNTCSLVRTELLAERQFRPEVFTAEDQEWARWLLEERGLATARISGAGMNNMANPYLAQFPFAKRNREYLAVALFARPQLLRFPSILRPLWTAAVPRRGISRAERGAAVDLFWELLITRFRGSARSSSSVEEGWGGWQGSAACEYHSCSDNC